MPTRKQVSQFLSEFKATVTLGFVRWVSKPAERQHLIDLGITQNQALELIHQLTPDNYSKGPEPDDMKPDRDVWIFGCDVDSTEAYIKLALQPHNQKKHIVFGLIWSFHKADHPLKYPLREN